MAYKEKNTNKWVASISYELLDGSKKRKRKYGFIRKKDAEDWERKNIGLREQNSDNPNINDVINEFIEAKKGTVKTSTLNKNIDIIKLHIKPYFKSKKILEVNHSILIKWRNELLNNQLSNARINKTIRSFKEIYNFAKPIYNISIDPFIQIKSLKEEPKKKINFYTLDEFNQFINSIDNIIYFTLFRVLYFTGIRRGELLNLRWNDINFENKTMSIVNYLDDNGESTLKNSFSVRIIKVDNKTLENLKTLKEHSKSTIRSFNNSMYIFYGNNSIPKSTLQKKQKYYIEKSGVKNIRLHDFRHSHASLLINNGANVLLVSKRLGHNDISMTLNTYSHLFNETEDKIIGLIENMAI